MIAHTMVIHTKQPVVHTGYECAEPDGLLQTVWQNRSTMRLRKVGLSVPWEYNVLDFLAKQNNIPAPRILDAGFDAETRLPWIEMEMVHGCSLDEIWHDLPDLGRKAIQMQLCDILEAIRSITPADLSNSPYLHDVFFWPRNKNDLPSYSGVETTAQFVDTLITTLERTSGIYDPERTKQAIGFLKALPTNQPLVFTHGHLDPRNIYVNIIEGKLKIVAIMDWAQAGYYPAYWEYVKANFWTLESDFVQDDGWSGVMEQHPLPMAVLSHARDLIW